MDFIDFHTHLPTAEGVISPRSFGIHPWDAEKEDADSYAHFVTKYEHTFRAAELVGECGLDKACAATWERQMQLFEWQLRLAEEMGKPVVVHCVRAFNELVALRRQYKRLAMAVHGFVGSSEMADQLAREGIVLSFGAAILDPRRTKVRETLARLPHPFLLETDTCDCGIEAVYQTAAEIRTTTTSALADTIKKTYTTFMSKTEYEKN